MVAMTGLGFLWVLEMLGLLPDVAMTVWSFLSVVRDVGIAMKQ